jgi:phenylacetate-coenzyme A ligase PaaK-like adenylate-forming protein
MPLLRYEVGDAGALSRQPCPCGRTQGAALLGRLEGRTFERLLSADGRAINAGIVHFIVRTSGIAPALQHYLAVQRQPGKVEFLLVPGETYRAEAAERLRATAAQVLGPGFEVKSQTVDEIPAGSGKKRSYFRSELAADLPEVGSPQAESREKP